ncbi:ThiF family adenylyltransferase [Streptomyces europaeiscabiei]|uniref:ThiF family adenylyltransferase n=1 Tax=Streptomyces europaeiscabiei TaxID=146819 RepID=UPI0029AFE7E8|nr:ThiF family adenylyltransferase [Streptomyces europaeiscabiei]MDX3586626.1 ThiF family adenylyltransferase [Streptomyces europaeiscabiei]
MSESLLPTATPGQQLAVTQLERIAATNRALELGRITTADEASGYPDWIEARLGMDCSTLLRTPAGLHFKRREAITLLIPPRFPFAVPQVRTAHTRFAGAPHVNWARYLCMYRSPATEWDPADGMYGFITRVWDWFQAAAAGELDTPGEPLHPPNALTHHAAGLLVVRHDAPTASGLPWIGAALLHRVRDDRQDVVGWLPLGSWPASADQARQTAALPPEADVFLAPALIATRQLTFEYPNTARELIRLLAGQGITPAMILGLIGVAAERNRTVLLPAVDPDDDTPVAPLYFLFGTPSRGIAGNDHLLPHLVAWSLPDLADIMGRLSAAAFDGYPPLAELGKNFLEQTSEKWLDSLPTRWARVQEARPEVTVRRDAGTPAEWLTGKQILVLGSGALGAPVAEMCVRAAAARVTVADSSLVHPGVLARQPYTDADIGLSKCRTLAGRLSAIAPHATRVEPLPGNIVTTLADVDVHSYDLIVDATANRIVRGHLEAARATAPTAWPPLATVMIGHQATRGIAAFSAPHGTGGGTDILRRTGLALRADATGAHADILDDFFPTQPRTDLFQPEPGCSDATFTGSAADATGLAGQLMTGILHALNTPEPQQTMAALTVRSPAGPHDPVLPGARWWTWPNDTVLTEEGGYQVRISTAALAEMCAEARRGARVRGPRVETGGMLLGAIDDATRILWIDEATGPPPDSLLSEHHFEHGTTGIREHLAARRTATQATTRFLGMWHTHPHGPARPSPTDLAAMGTITLPLEDTPSRALILIAGGTATIWNAWLKDGEPPHFYARLADRTDTPAPPAGRASTGQPDITWWPGGYATQPYRQPAPRRSDDTRP